MRIDRQSIFKKCFICNGNMRFFLEGRDYLYGTTDKIFDIYKCFNCGVEQILPMPSGDELSSFYPKDYYSYNVLLKNKKRKGFFLKVREKVVDRAYNGATKKDGYYLLALLAKPFFSGLPLRWDKSKNFLDVGCGDAYNVKLMSQYGWNALGFEIGPKRNEGSIYYDTDLTNVNFDGLKFDYIRIWHVLEHVSNPDQFLEKIKSLISDGGRIAIGVPNTASVCASLFGRYWYNRDVPRHVINYSPLVLKKILEKHGLRIKRLSYTSVGGFLGSIQHALNDMFNCHLNLMGNVFLLGVFSPLDMLFNVFKRGDCLSIVVEK